MYLRDWAKRVPGMAIVSVDMSLSPENIFPVPVQEILDTYLWLISGHVSVREKLGFHPQKVVFNGDSSGSCIALVTMFVLNDIRAQDPDAIRQMPVAHVGVYSSFTSDPHIYPSAFMLPSHWILTPCVLTSFMEKYIPHVFPYVKRTNHEKYIDDAQQKSLLNQAWNGVRYLVGLKPARDSVPWYKAAEPADIAKYMVEEMKLTRHPYISPLLYQDMYSLRDVKMYLIACDNDPILDQSVIMARKWRGKCHACATGRNRSFSS